jgi:ParB family chromosome partitioning protein
MEIALIENIQREDLNPIETAKALERLQTEFNLTQEALSERLGKERATLANYVRLLKLPEEAQKYMAEGKLSMGHAKVILAFESQSHQLEAARAAVRERLSVRQMEKLLAKRLLGGKHKENLRKALLKAKDPDVADLEERLIKSLGTKVRLRHRGKKGGRVEIEYYSLDELQRLLEKLL